jgi:hypothetical protein
MQHIQTLPVFLFVIFDIAYIGVCIYLGVRHRAAVMRAAKKGHKKAQVASAVLLAVFTVYIMTKWTVQQLMMGCITIGFWNPACYDLNLLNRSWLAVVTVVGLNALLLSFLFDIRSQDRRK